LALTTMDFLAVDHEDVVLGLVRGGFLGAHSAAEAALRGVIFEQVGEVVGRHDVADGDDIERRAEEALFTRGRGKRGGRCGQNH
jgi:hypothetical protein